MQLEKGVGGKNQKSKLDFHLNNIEEKFTNKLEELTPIYGWMSQVTKLVIINKIALRSKTLNYALHKCQVY